jgi:arginase
MADAAGMPVPWPEAASIEERSLEEQIAATARVLPERPLVLGGCCCTHVGAVEGLAARQGRLSLIWFDAHGDLNTPETSPSGNQWGMPLRMLLDSGAVAPEDVALVGARDLDPPEEEFITHSGVHTGEAAVERALEGTRCTYVAFDADAVEPSELSVFMPEPDGLRLDEAERLLAGIRDRTRVLGAGLTGLSFEPSNVEPLARLTRALGL